MALSPLLLGFLVATLVAAPAMGQATDVPPSRSVALVTGSTDGLGREVARRIASTGAHVIIHGRSRDRGMELVREIEREGKGSARFFPADFSSLAQVRALADSIRSHYDRLDLLINNAGIWVTSGARQRSVDGHEMHFAVNYLAPFVLTRELLPLVRKSSAGRIINVASVAQTPVDFDDVMLEDRYSGSRAYGQSKLALIMFTMDLATELQGTKISANAVHPATLMATTMVRAAGVPPRATVEEGADALMQLVSADSVGSGKYFNGKREMRANAQAYDDAARRKLRMLSVTLTQRP